jgi:hypothetical protein
MNMRNAIKILGLVAALALSACGSDKGDDLGRFVGTWHATSGTGTKVCGGNPATFVVSGDMVWTTGVSSDLVSPMAFGSCPLAADVTNSTAAGLPGQTCTDSDGAGTTATISLTSYTFVISPDGHTATENLSAQLNVVDQGVSAVCTINATGSYQKLSN